jgi:hypothetical protein
VNLARNRGLRALAGVMLLVAGCGGDDDSADTPRPTVTTAAPDPGTQFEVLAKELAPKLYGFEAAEEAPGGVVTLKLGNGGALRHEAAVARVGQTPVEQVRRDLAGVLSGEGPIPDYLELYGGVPEILGGTEQSTTLTLPEGDYVLYCSLRDTGQGGSLGDAEPHFELGMIQPLRVRGDNGLQLPSSIPTVSAGEYGFEFQPLPPGANRVLFKNVGPDQMHLAAFLEFPEGVDEETALPALLGQGEPAAAPVQRVVAGPFVPGGGGTFVLALKPDRVYGLVCSLRDRAGGPAHLTKGMVGVFRPQ